ncbi:MULTISPECIES: Asp-tRNA(Asn)/Glu-tRNA(Gln) amidotransferase subunit GatC [Corynebacterium]|uniref:Aspartyl/glutamyl-tRNA(Asn/Gln) amidotransferase subunit C n=1 Tax=Corynebacterium lipophiloflavum (strain ATCC 700352 / DSM 44291 / CCUG 37336 / JCM 10383 / DMMZ 1944) TaxID=525263 RepID=C0XPI6_CORLD|nr:MULTISPECIES: Asp-tRNA(Asn)/Glu-tRNA(Gln) amidotransferase subunit GatC [Corynebacterium]EEI17860.1 aspartyl/glutamyl-tRNA(Asn/Gln) amidotransferase, C subunit [Corynebacterium lipophiloflavum DSM 44291]MCT1412164.1 Asp-tRNA(Asn)/Glu-tRNA(Gln) amidotransferase subunit GatC [Corynebacterium sanguinis]MCT1445030.1 Asp-tRNA(Asn)/Glu-tRNA(Gln) amidotransferase subunit GatC [Corynebacterium sanguinis]MCT1597895.1 Asp-tRNA(Asn)/Glu-tRNA(Gln) amidotransferase subunit GatC [Corynebacterium sanguinis
MSEISRDEVSRIARLARIALSDEELDQIAPQLDHIVDAVSKVRQVDTEGVTPMSHPHSIDAGMRKDVEKRTLTQKQALDQAPAVEEERFVVPQILGEGD